MLWKCVGEFDDGPAFLVLSLAGSVAGGNAPAMVVDPVRVLLVGSSSQVKSNSPRSEHVGPQQRRACHLGLAALGGEVPVAVSLRMGRRR